VDAEKYGMTRDELYFKMKEQNVLGRRYFYPLISEFSTYRGLPSSNPENLPNAHKMALVVTDVEGENYLIGTKERPYPVIEYTREISGSNRVYDVKVTFSGKRALIPCAI
jgi:hypothetical protein